jgi:hypothetical protein
MGMENTKRVTLIAVRRVAERFGATVDERHTGFNARGNEYAVNVDLPPGKTWRANGLHNICSVSDDRNDACADAVDRMNYGVDEGLCGEDCDICRA